MRERINEGFGSGQDQAWLSNEEAVMLLLFRLLRSGQVKLRRLVGWHNLTTVSAYSEAA